MATYLMLLNWTDQEIKNIKESPKAVGCCEEAGQRFRWGDQNVLYDAREFRSCLVADMPSSPT